MAGLASYLAKRLLIAIPTIFGLLTLAFIISHVIPSNPLRLAAGKDASAAELAQLAVQFGFNLPLPLQYLNYLEGFFLHFNLGVSVINRQPVLSQVLQFLPASLQLVGSAMLLVILISLPLGVLGATHKERPLDHTSRLIALGGVAVPGFWLAFVLQIIFAYDLHWLPVSGIINPALVPEHITGLYVVDSLITANFPSFISALSHLILPAVVLALQSQAIITRMTRSSMLEELQKDYVRTSRAFGFSERVTVYRHVLKNALVPTTTHFGIAFGALFADTVIVEKIFSYPGLGNYIANSILNLDFPAIMGGVIVLGIVVILTNLVVDLVYMFIDPRIRYE